MKPAFQKRSLPIRLAAAAAVNAVVLSAAALCSPARPVRDDPSGQVGDAAVRVRPGSQELLEQALATIEKVESRTERLASFARKGDDLKGKSDSLRREIVELYRLIHSLERMGDELLLRGERDGEVLRARAAQLNGPLADAVTQLRPALGSPTGLVNAATRRAKEQLGLIKQLDDRIKRQQWTMAHELLEDLLDAADEVGRFPDAAESESLFRPLLQRVPEVRLGYLTEQKATLIAALNEEFSKARPDLEHLRKQCAVVADLAKEQRPLRWNEQSIRGPDLLTQIADRWAETDEAVLQAAAVLHAMGPTAESEFRSLRSDYEAARIQALTLMRDVINADAQSSEPANAEQLYMAYVTVIPRMVTALHGTHDNAMACVTALSQLAAKSPEFDAKVRSYRAATDEAFRWRSRLANAYWKKLKASKAAEPLATMLEKPPARPGEATGAPQVPGQQAPPAQRRMVHAVWRIDQSPESVASLWTEQWKDTPARAAVPSIRWLASGEPKIVSQWQGRVVGEFAIARQTMLDELDRLARDLRLGPNRGPLTLEVSWAVHTAVHGPLQEIAGRIVDARLDNLPDRLFDSHEPYDVVGALAHGTLTTFPDMPALVQLQFRSEWLVHDLFAWFERPAPPSPDSPKSAVEPPVATARGKVEPPGPTAADESPAAPSKPTGTTPGAATDGSSAPDGSAPKKPAASPAPPPPGGVKF